MKDFFSDYKKDNSLIQRRGGERDFEYHHRHTLEGFRVTIDNNYEKNALIQKHSNPINSYLEDKYFTVLNRDKEGVRWGSYVDDSEGNTYIILTNPASTDGITLKSKIRKTTTTALFTIGSEGVQEAYECIETNYLLYDDKTYVTDTKVFEDDDRRAIVVPYNDFTKLVRVIDDVVVEGLLYRIISREFITEIKDGKEEGVVQMVLLRTTFGELYCNDNPLRGIVRFARMKDKILNSKSRELITDHNLVKSGDIITHTYERDSLGNIETRNYIIRSLIDMRLEYDITYMLNCDAEFYMWDGINQQSKMIPCYVEDNRTRLEELDKQYIKMENSQYQIIVQENEFTSKLGKSVGRIILKGEAYEVVGTDNLSLENAIYIGLNSSKLDPNKDNIELGIADFDNQYIKPDIPPTNLAIIGEDYPCISCTYTYSIDYNGVVDWSISDTSLASMVEVTDNTFTIQIVGNSNYIGEVFQVKAVINGEDYLKEVVVSRW